MNQKELKQFMKKLNLPEGEYVLFGGTSLAMLGLRDCNDVDLLVSDKLYEQLKQQGWVEDSITFTSPYLMNTIEGIEVDVFRTLEGGKWKPQPTEHYLRNPEVLQGLAHMPLDDLYDWKAITRRPKDLADLKLIDEYRKRAP